MLETIPILDQDDDNGDHNHVSVIFAIEEIIESLERQANRLKTPEPPDGWVD